MKARNLLLFLLLLPFPGAAQQGKESYLIPETVYVGDRARLLIYLEGEFAGTAPFTLEDPADLPQGKDIRVHRLELDYRRGEPGPDIPGRPRLLVDFTAFAPGPVDLPPLPLAGGPEIGGLRVNIASVLGPGQEALILSEAALPLPVPGTVALIVGAALGFLLLLLGGTGGALWARRNLGAVLEIRRKRRLVALMEKAERRFRQRLSEGDCQTTLGLISAEFRSFLSRFTGYNCLAMSAGEFFAMPPLLPPNPVDQEAGGEGPAAGPGGALLGPFFRNLDRLRYSGEEPGSADLRALLDDLRNFTGSLGKALRGGRG